MSIHKFNTDIQHEGRLIVERVADISVLPYDSTSSVTDEARILYDEASDNLYYGTISTFKPIQSGAEPFTKVIDVAGGGDYSSIATAVSTEPAGTSFFIKSGTYNESLITITKSGQSLIGESEEGVIINGHIDINSAAGAETLGQGTIVHDSTTFNDSAATFQTDGITTGDIITLHGGIFEVASVTDENNLEITTPWKGKVQYGSTEYRTSSDYIKNLTLKNLHINGVGANSALSLKSCYNCDISNVQLNGPDSSPTAYVFNMNTCHTNRIQLNYALNGGCNINFVTHNNISITRISNSSGSGLLLDEAFSNIINIKYLIGNDLDGVTITEARWNHFYINDISYNNGSGIDIGDGGDTNEFNIIKAIYNDIKDLTISGTSNIDFNVFTGYLNTIDLGVASDTRFLHIRYTSITGGVSTKGISTVPSQTQIHDPLNFRHILDIYTSSVVVDNTTGAAEDIIICDSTSYMEVDLPAISSTNKGKSFTIKNINAASPGVTVDANGSDVVETIAAFGTAATDIVAAGDAIRYIADNTNKTWWLI